jgi:hypothetical protein
MITITAKDLKESLNILYPENVSDQEGGFTQTWKRGPRIWASLWPQLPENKYKSEDEGGPFASNIGYLKSLPSPRYKLFMRAGIQLPNKFSFLWNLRKGTKQLQVVSTPVLIQNNRFYRMNVVENTHG